MIPYGAALAAFLEIFLRLPLPFIAYILTMIILYLGVNFVMWIVGKLT